MRMVGVAVFCALASGSVLAGSPLWVADDAGDEVRGPGVTYNDGVFLIVYEAVGQDVRAVRVSASGAILDATAIDIAVGTGTAGAPTAAALGDGFAVAWWEAHGHGNRPTHDIMGTEVTVDGSVAGTTLLAGDAQRNATLPWLTGSNDRLVLGWRSISVASGFDTAFRAGEATMDGALAAPVASFGMSHSYAGFMQDFRPWPCGDGIAGAHGMQGGFSNVYVKPCVGDRYSAPVASSLMGSKGLGFTTNGPRTVLAWAGLAAPELTTRRDIFTLVLDETGQRLGDDDAVAEGNAARQAPAVALDDSAYVTVWLEDGALRWARRALDGEFLDGASPSSSSLLADEARYPAIAAGPPGIFLVVWRGAPGSSDLFAARLAFAGPGELDVDGDGVPTLADNCPALPNDQSDADADGSGDACDPCPFDADNADYDRDGFCGASDLCPRIFEVAQLDEDGDGIGDDCDPCAFDVDEDHDGACDEVDNCPGMENASQSDVDSDGLGDACDPCWFLPAIGDADGDGFCDPLDNCPALANDQADLDGDEAGDDCDDDIDGDGLSNEVEQSLSLSPTNADSDGDWIADGEEVSDPEAPRDSDGDGIIDAIDLDSDDDRRSDAMEAGDQDLATAAVDANNDGLPAYRDPGEPAPAPVEPDAGAAGEDAGPATDPDGGSRFDEGDAGLHVELDGGGANEPDGGLVAEPDAGAALEEDAGETTTDATSSCSCGAARSEPPLTLAWLICLMPLARRRWSKLAMLLPMIVIALGGCLPGCVEGQPDGGSALDAGDTSDDAGAAGRDGGTISGDDAGNDAGRDLEHDGGVEAPNDSGVAADDASSDEDAGSFVQGCGNGVVERPLEECDDGENGGGYDECNPDCTWAAYCGDGAVDPAEGESCDDGHVDGRPGGCHADCTFVSECGNGVVEVNESCDDGLNDSSYGSCTPSCAPGPRCGDGLVQWSDGEDCELGDPACDEVCRYLPGIGFTIAGAWAGILTYGAPATASYAYGLADLLVRSDGDIFLILSSSAEIARVERETGFFEVGAVTPSSTGYLDGVLLRESETAGLFQMGGWIKRLDFSTTPATFVNVVTSSALSSPRIRGLLPSGELLATVTPGTVTAYQLFEPWTATHFAGDGGSSYAGDGGLATEASFINATELRMDAYNSHAYVLDAGAHVIRRVDLSTGVITTFAGNGVLGYAGDGGPATSASFIGLRDLVVDRDGNVFISDPGANVVRRVDGIAGEISTVAGTGREEFQGDGWREEYERNYVDPLHLGVSPEALALDERGNLYIACSTSRVRIITGVTAGR